MTQAVRSAIRRPLRLYAAGHAALLGGAWGMHVTGSMWPIAFAASTCIMLTVPIVRHLVAQSAARRR